MLTSLVAQTVKHLPTMQETGVWSLHREDPLEKEMVTHSSILAWKIPWTEKRGRLQSTGSQRVRHYWATSLSPSILQNTKNMWWNLLSAFGSLPVWNWVYVPKGMLMAQGPYTNAPQHLCATGKGHWTFASYFSAQEFLFLIGRSTSFASENLVSMIWQQHFPDLYLQQGSLSWICVCVWMCVERVRGRGMLGWERANTDRKHTLKFSLFTQWMLLSTLYMSGTS